MRQYLNIILGLAAFALASCAGPKYVPVSLEPVKASVTGAQTTSKAAQSKVVEAQASTAKAQAAATSANDKITQLEKQVANDADALKLAQGAKSDVDELTKELTYTQYALKDVNNKLTWTWDQLQSANQQIDVKQKTLNENDKAVANAAEVEAKYHKLKWSICFLAAGAVALLLAKFWKLLAPLGYIGIGIMVGLPSAVFVFLAFKL